MGGRCTSARVADSRSPPRAPIATTYMYTHRVCHSRFPFIRCFFVYLLVGVGFFFARCVSLSGDGVTRVSGVLSIVVFRGEREREAIAVIAITRDRSSSVFTARRMRFSLSYNVYYRAKRIKVAFSSMIEFWR